MADTKLSTTTDDKGATVTQPTKADRVTVYNRKGVAANPLKADVPKWEAKGWSTRNPKG